MIEVHTTYDARCSKCSRVVVQAARTVDEVVRGMIRRGVFVFDGWENAEIYLCHNCNAQRNLAREMGQKAAAV